MSINAPPAPSFLTSLVANRRQVAIGLAAAGVILAALSVWWGVWGFARSDTAPAKADGKLLPEETEKPPEPADTGKPKKSPDYQIACIWAGSVALLCLLCAAWVYTQPADPVAPLTSARVEALTFGGTVGLLTALCGVFLGYRWHQSLVLWVGGGDRREAKWVLYAAAVFLAGLLTMFASLQLARSEQRANAGLRRILYGFNSVFVGLLLLLVLIAVNVTAFLKAKQPFVTNDTAFTALAEKSKDYLHSLDRPVHVYLIMPEGYSVPINRRLTYDNLYADCRGLLGQCEDESRDFKWTYLSPAFDKDRIGAIMERLRVKEADRDQFGMLAAVGENEEAHSFVRANELIDVDAAGENLVFQGENKLLTELMYLTDARAKEKVYFTQDHGELTIEPGGERDKSAGKVVQFLRDRKMTVEPLTFDGPNAKVPDDAAVVVVAGLRRTLAPDSFMVTALREYVRRPEKPGKLFVCLPAFRDPAGKVAATGLEGFLAEFGVEVSSDRRIIAVPRQLPLPPENVLIGPFARLDPELARVVGDAPLVLKDARPVRPSQAMPGAPPRASQLMGTGIATWQEADYGRSPDVIWAELRADPRGPLWQEKRVTDRAIPVAVAVIESGQSGEKPIQKPRMIVFGSDTFLQDSAPALTGAEEFRQQLFSDSIDWLRERDASIGIPPRKLGMFALEKPIDWPTQVVLLVMVTIGITALGVGVWLSRRR
jgi:gliding motility-associatede transport system auxiliary component